MNKTLESNIKKVEILIDNEFFTCIKSIDEEDRVEWGISYKTSLEKTINHLVELYNRIDSSTETNKA